MKKVVYSVTRYRKDELIKISGLGYITEEDLIIACNSKEGKPYIRVFEGCIKNCHAISDRDNEYKGFCVEVREVEFDTTNGSKEPREIDLEYKIWYKLVD